MLEVKVLEVRTGPRRLGGATTSTPARRSPFIAGGALVESVVVVVVVRVEAVEEAAVDEPRERPLDIAGGDPGPEAAPPDFGAARHPLPVTLPPPAPPTPPTTPP